MIDTTLTVSNMSCNHCVQRVTRALSGLEGVHEIDVDRIEGTVRVCHAPDLPPAILAETVNAAGYPSQPCLDP